MLPKEFYELSRAEQVKLLTFEQIRQAQEMKELGQLCEAAAVGSIKR